MAHVPHLPPSRIKRSRSHGVGRKLSYSKAPPVSSRSFSINNGTRLLHQSSTSGNLSQLNEQEERKKGSLRLFSKHTMSSEIFNNWQTTNGDRLSADSEKSQPPGISFTKSVNLSNGQKKALQITWMRMYDPVRPSRAVALMETVFKELMKKEPVISRLFASCAFVSGFEAKMSGKETRIETVRDHAKFMVWFIDQIISNLDSPCSFILDQLKDFGEKHSKLKNCGLTSKIWDTFGECFVEKLVLQEGVRRFPEGPKAWNQLTATIIDSIYCGFNKRRNSVETRNTVV